MNKLQESEGCKIEGCPNHDYGYDNDCAEWIDLNICKIRESFIELKKVNKEILDALTKAREFIKNGVEYGYITMPNMETDTANETPKIINKVIEKTRRDT